MKIIKHEFKVINTKSLSNVLMGRDFMKRFSTVKFDYERNQIQLGNSWLPCVGIKAKEKVRLISTTKIPARSEQVVAARCKKRYSMLNVDFEPQKLQGAPGIFVTKEKVIPNINGVFLLTVLNVSEIDVNINGRKVSA